jgi:N-acetylneuraminate epimerase
MKTAIFALIMSSVFIHAEPAWKKLASIPNAEGFAGPFAGVSNDVLLVAGGANFPDKKPWEGGTKVWYDTIFALEKPDGEWKRVGKLPRPLGYGVSLTTRDGVLCIGGSDAREHHREVFILSYQDGKVNTKPLPNLPRPCANACGAMMGDKVYVAGGIEKPDATEAMNTLWCLDLKNIGEGWQQLAPIPGKGRMLSIMGVMGGLHLFSGTALLAGPDGKPQRDWLKEALHYSDGEWSRSLMNLPREAVAAPGPCPSVDGCLWIIGGDDGTQVNVPPSEHRGFPRDILGYDRKMGVWRNRGEVPFSLVTTVAVPWKNMIVIPGGEAKPGIRSTEVWALELPRD